MCNSFKYPIPGDRILDAGDVRTVSYVWDEEVYFEDGGCMSLAEVDEVYLEGEEI